MKPHSAEKKINFKIEAVRIDAGYNTVNIYKKISDINILGAMGFRRGCHQKGKFGKYKFTYIKDWDVYIYLERNYLSYVTTARGGYREMNEGKEIYKRRKETIRRSFTDSKEVQNCVAAVCADLKKSVSDACLQR